MNPWAAIIGRRSSGKREVTQDVVQRLRKRGLTVGGSLQVPIVEGSQTVGFDLVDLVTGDQVPFARQSDEPELCDFAFDRDALALAQRGASYPDLDVVVLDLGKLEARGTGHWPAVQRALQASSRIALLCIRQDALFPIADRLSDPIAGLELPTTDADIEAFADQLLEARRGATSSEPAV